MPGDNGAPSSDHHFGVISALGLIDLEPRSLGECSYIFEKLFRSLRHKNMCTPYTIKVKGGTHFCFRSSGASSTQHQIRIVRRQYRAPDGYRGIQ